MPGSNGSAQHGSGNSIAPVTQLQQIRQPIIRAMWRLEQLMLELCVDWNYVQGIVDRMNSEGELGTSHIDELKEDGLDAVIVALKKHKRRGGGVVRQSRVYVLHPA